MWWLLTIVLCMVSACVGFLLAALLTMSKVGEMEIVIGRARKEVADGHREKECKASG